MQTASFLGVGFLAGDQGDLSGLAGFQTDGTPHSQLGGLGSAIDYTGEGNSYVLISDRGPKDGATDYACRYHRMEIVVKPEAAAPVELKLTATTLLRDERGRGLVGTLTALDAEKPEESLRFDAEGIRVGRSGTLFIADEYGPSICEFGTDGKRMRKLPLPGRYLPERYGVKPEEEMPPRNRKGRQANRGFEGLAISVDGSTLYGLMQSALITDGGLDEANQRVGMNLRILELDIHQGQTREYVYQVEDAAHGVSEIVAVDETRFLVMELDNRGGGKARFKKVFQIDLEGASDVSGIVSLPSRGLPRGVRAVKKELYLDLLDERYGLAGADFPEKIEGLSFGPGLGDGRRVLLVTADNDFVSTAPFRVFAFGV